MSCNVHENSVNVTTVATNMFSVVVQVVAALCVSVCARACS